MISTDKTALRDAATVIVLRDIGGNRRILMGQRGAKAAFMPNKFVFPGGAVDPGDGAVPLARPLSEITHHRVAEDGACAPSALAAAAIRELWEETGLRLGQPGTWSPPAEWAAFAATGLMPDAAPLQFFFRAITPPGRPRRFDARFFLIDAEQLDGDLDDFTHASDELSQLQWIPLADARAFNLPFITEVVLAEVAKITQVGPPASVPFFKNDDEESLFMRLGGRS